MKIILLLVYLWNGQLTIEQKPFDTREACVRAGLARLEVLTANPSFTAGIFADCIEAKALVAELK